MSLIVAGARTAIGRFDGVLREVDAVELGATAVAAALDRAGVAPGSVDCVILGQGLQAGQGQAPARQAAVRAGVPMTVPAMTVNKVCLSGMTAVHLADQMIAAGEADIVVAGGMESMSRAPYLMPNPRVATGDVVASLAHDGLLCAFDGVSMGKATERYAAAAGISRERQDAYAAQSHHRAATAAKEGRLAEEIVPVRTGDRTVADDEGIRPDTSAETLAELEPAFTEGGAITAGNSSQIADGAAAVLVASRRAADRLSVPPLGEIVAKGQVAGPDPALLLQPARGAKRALDRAGLRPADVDLFELNEAFAAVALASMDDLGVPDTVVNVNGGAVALGHPIGMSGARLTLSLLHELRRRGGGTGVAALCGGGGQGEALAVRTVS